MFQRRRVGTMNRRDFIKTAGVAGAAGASAVFGIESFGGGGSDDSASVQATNATPTATACSPPLALPHGRSPRPQPRRLQRLRVTRRRRRSLPRRRSHLRKLPRRRRRTLRRRVRPPQSHLRQIRRRPRRRLLGSESSSRQGPLAIPAMTHPTSTASPGIATPTRFASRLRQASMMRTGRCLLL